MPVPVTHLADNALGLLAFPGQERFLEAELEGRHGFSSQEIARAKKADGLLFFTGGRAAKLRAEPPYWCRTMLLKPFTVTFASIGEAAAALRQIQRSWAAYPTTAFRRTALIQQKLPYINLKPRAFPPKIPAAGIGLYSLLDNNTLIASAETTSPFPCGTIEFVEDRENPPSRAYLKLREAFTNAMLFFDRMPTRGNRCLDAGACPGGWTWTLRQLGCEVVAVDRTELAPSLMKDSAVAFMRHDAFTIPPEELGPFDWVLSDVACYPERLLGWVRRWLESGLCRNMVCTIKLQGQIDWNTVGEFAAIPGSRVVHLNYNKHELTWIHCG